MTDDRVYFFDTTLRDGAQTQGVDFNPVDKEFIARELDRVGMDYIEGGWPGANPTDDDFFSNLPPLKRSKLVAFGMTRRPGRSTENDPGLTALISAGTQSVCMVGKSWDLHVDVALKINRDENVTMISDSVRYAAGKLDEVIFDAEHFFDGYKSNSEFALRCVMAAYDAGARWVVLCDTNGGTLPHEIEEIVAEVCKQVPGKHIGIHTHDDTGNAVANSLAAVRAGARQVQGTLNGLGERCGNANLISIIPTLVLKMDYETNVHAGDLEKLTHLSRMVDERLNRAPNRGAPYVGESAFAHKGGLHVSAVEKDPRTYEHIDPDVVGNERRVLVSDLAGRSSVAHKAEQFGIDMTDRADELATVLSEIKQLESSGFQFEGAEASLELLMRKDLKKKTRFFRLVEFRVIDEKPSEDEHSRSEASVRIEGPDGKPEHTVASGNGPVNALDSALRKALNAFFEVLAAHTIADLEFANGGR